VVSLNAADVLGVRVDALPLPGLVEQTIRTAQVSERRTVLYANVHVLNTACGDPELRAILNAADLVYCDGAGVALGARLLGYRLPGRMTGADWIEPLCAACAETGTALYFLGGRPGVAARAAELLQGRYPGLCVAGSHHGYLADPAVCTDAIAAVNAASPHILLVGMGTPTQEKWIAAHRARLEVAVVWAVGALFDFVAGAQPRGPRWMLDNGLEWLYRFYSDPRRLWRRYVVGNPLFLARVLAQRFGHLSLVIGHSL
jgi:N-acetylglucosaminyldiphosphoundecaprenol N-acetyl-beta-D-mannosaminyltransferase